MIEINRIWAMPNKHTFTIKPIYDLLNRYKVGNGWADPFAGENSPAEITNDLNPEKPTQYHLDAKEFVKSLEKIDGVLFDPPYSLRQIKECYDNIGIPLDYNQTLDASFSEVKNILADKIEKYVISFGWNSNGFGINRGFELVEILLIPHGGHHNDTIITVEKKNQLRLAI